MIEDGADCRQFRVCLKTRFSVIVVSSCKVSFVLNCHRFEVSRYPATITSVLNQVLSCSSGRDLDRGSGEILSLRQHTYHLLPGSPLHTFIFLGLNLILSSCFYRRWDHGAFEAMETWLKIDNTPWDVIDGRDANQELKTRRIISPSTSLEVVLCKKEVDDDSDED